MPNHVKTDMLGPGTLAAALFLVSLKQSNDLGLHIHTLVSSQVAPAHSQTSQLEPRSNLVPRQTPPPGASPVVSFKTNQINQMEC